MYTYKKEKFYLARVLHMPTYYRPALQTRLLSTEEMDKFKAVNDPVREYLAGSTDRQRLEKRLAYYSNTCTEVPIVIGDEQIQTKDVRYQVMVCQQTFYNLVLQ